MPGEGEDLMPAKIEKVWSCYGGCHFNGRENGHITELASLKEANSHGTEVASLIMIMLERWPV